MSGDLEPPDDALDSCPNLYLLVCPKCSLMASQFNLVDAAEVIQTSKHRGHLATWKEWRCWRCDHRIGMISDKGTLDIGIIPEATHTELARTNYAMFFEEFDRQTVSAETLTARLTGELALGDYDKTEQHGRAPAEFANAVAEIVQRNAPDFAHLHFRHGVAQGVWNYLHDEGLLK